MKIFRGVKISGNIESEGYQRIKRDRRHWPGPVIRFDRFPAIGDFEPAVRDQRFWRRVSGAGGCGESGTGGGDQGRRGENTMRRAVVLADDRIC